MCSPHRVPHHVPNEIDYGKINVETNLGTAVSPVWPHWMFLWCLHCYVWKDSTPFLSISLLNLGMKFWLHLPAEIKVQTSINYKTCKRRYKWFDIDQTDQSTTWKKPVSDLKVMQIVGFEQTSTKFIEIFVL